MKKHKQYTVGLYCRLSKDDVGSGDSSSIHSQKAMLEQYVHDNGWTVYGCYIDDGYSGTNYNRPDFQRMLDDIENGSINMVVVKDLSRLGRNYLMTGQYTDIYFPDRGVRFVALNDGIDTLNHDNEIAPFKNILNEMYSKDISKKVRSAVRSRKQRGEYLSNYAPYGYMKDPVNKRRLIIEERGASVVRRMYEMCASGQGSKVIAKTLTREGVLTPRNHRYKLEGKAYDPTGRWFTETVHHILRSRIYLGDMVQGVYACSQFKRTPSKRKPREDWIITPNTHEAIVDVVIWEQVQNALDSRQRVLRSGEVQLFSGFVKCADCGHALAYAYCQGIPQYSCGQYRRHGKDACSCHYVRKDMLERVVLNDIRQHARLAQGDRDSFVSHLQGIGLERDAERAHTLEHELGLNMVRVSELDGIIKQLFEQLTKGTLTDSRFQKLSAEYEAEQSGLELRIEAIQNELVAMRRGQMESEQWIERIERYADITALDRIVLSELIEKITVGEARIVNGEKVIDITIYYRFVGAVGQKIA